MPHLSPLNWLLTPIIFWSMLSLFMMYIWWSQSLTLLKPLSIVSAPHPFPWKW